MDYLRNLLTPGDTVFDIGANQGKWWRLALKAARPLTIHAFEPDPATDPSGEGVIVNRVGIGAVVERGRTFYHYANTCYSTLYQRPGLLHTQGTPTATKIDLTTIDTYCAEHGIDKIDFCKIDVECHELAVLLGAQHTLPRIKAIQFEWFTPNPVGVCLTDITEVLDGFKVQHLEGHNYLATRH